MNSRADFIIPECYIDTNLVETLAHIVGCNHQKGCNQVARVMRDKFANRFAVGVIDADKRRPAYLKEFVEIASSEHLQLLHHTSRAHYIILIHPAADGFILSCAEAAMVNLLDFDLKTDLQEFTAQTKNVMSNKDVRFKQLFKTIQGFGEMKLLAALLGYFSDNTYRSSDDDIIRIFQNMK